MEITAKRSNFTTGICFVLFMLLLASISFIRFDGSMPKDKFFDIASALLPTDNDRLLRISGIDEIESIEYELADGKKKASITIKGRNGRNEKIGIETLPDI